MLEPQCVANSQYNSTYEVTSPKSDFIIFFF